MTDFEISAITALEDVYENIDIDYCLFHLSKNAFTNIQKKSLHAAYENSDARTFLRCLPALAFLPIDDVSAGFHEVKLTLMEMELFAELHLEDNLRDYLNYFEKTYVRRRVRGVQTEGLLPSACWNCNAAALTGLPKTNVAMEGWHKGFNARFSRSHMSFSQFIIRLKAEEEKTRQMAVRTRVNPAEVLCQGRQPGYVKREDNLKMLVQGYQADQKMNFLKAVQHHLARFPLIQQNTINEEHTIENIVEM